MFAMIFKIATFNNISYRDFLHVLNNREVYYKIILVSGAHQFVLFISLYYISNNSIIYRL